MRLEVVPADEVPEEVRRLLVVLDELAERQSRCYASVSDGDERGTR